MQTIENHSLEKKVDITCKEPIYLRQVFDPTFIIEFGERFNNQAFANTWSHGISMLFHKDKIIIQKDLTSA